MAEAAISSLVQMLGNLVMKKVKFLRGVEGQVESLKAELERMQAFLIDANKKQYEDARVRHWISEMRELAQDAEDTIEMFLVNAETNVRNEGLLGRCTGFPNCITHLVTIGDEIESIQEKLEAIKRSRDTYGIRDLGEAAESTQRLQVEWLRRCQIDQHPVGLEDDVEMLLRESILDEDKRGLLIAVVEGMGGIGKSTLAQVIYSHPDVVARFDCRAWVVVSSDFTPQETIKQLILELGGADEQELRLVEDSTKDKLYLQQKLQQMLSRQLESKNYFIVLDDVWEKEHLEYIMSAFPDEKDKKSRLMITTRTKAIGKGQYVHEMKGLNLEKSWELLLKKAFVVDGECTCSQELESIGKQILQKCNGLPLAINVVGGLLVQRQTKSAWEQVLDEINSHLGSATSNVSAILELSYQNLSPQLKSCFLCLAFFKEDANIPAKMLLHIWGGMGLIQQEGRTRAEEEIGRSYLDELINRNMVQLKDLTWGDVVKNCYVHDLVREVCLRKAKEEIGFVMVKGKDTVESSLKKQRHRIVYDENSGYFSVKHNKHLRSLFLVNVYNYDMDRVDVSTHVLRYWKSFQLLKILDIDGFEMGRLPQCFRTLIGLKYLRIHRGSKETLKLPKWLDELKKLEAIDMGSRRVEFPNIELKMESLRYFNAYSVYGLNSIKAWKNIETLREISVLNWMKCSSKPMATCHVRELGIDMTWSDCELSSVGASLEKLENLVKLHLLWSFKHALGAELIISNLGNLTKLSLCGMMGKCPAASLFPPNLSHLTLKLSKLKEDIIAELGKLPSLLYLKLKKDAYDGQRMQVLRGGWPRLKSLSLQDLYIKSIDIEEGGMPHLKHIRVQHCPDLNTQNLPEHIIISAA